MFDWSGDNGDMSGKKLGKSHGNLISCVSGNPALLDVIMLRILPDYFPSYMPHSAIYEDYCIICYKLNVFLPNPLLSVKSVNYSESIV